MIQKLKYISIGIIVLAALIGAGAHVYQRVRGEVVPPLPKFSFNQEQADGWWGRENVNVQEVARTSEYTGEQPIDELPVADTTLFHGDPSGSKSRPSDECFITYSYYNHPLGDTTTAYDDYFDLKTKAAGKLDSFEPIQRSIRTFEGEKEYELHQYRFTVEDQTNFQGYQVGFIPLSEGYIRTEGVCKTYEDLAETLTVLGSVELLAP